MERMIAYCGIVCTECPAFIATQKDDDDLRKQTAEFWSQQFNVDLKPDIINCKEGCLSDGDDIFGHCQVCEIRSCAKEKKVDNCAHCDEYACEKLSDFHERAPYAKTVLDEVRSGL